MLQSFVTLENYSDWHQDMLCLDAFLGVYNE